MQAHSSSSVLELNSEKVGDGSDSDSDPTLIDESSDSSLNLSDIDDEKKFKNVPYNYHSLPKMKSMSMPKGQGRSDGKKVVSRHLTTGTFSYKSPYNNFRSFDKLSIPPNRFWSSMFRCNMQDDETNTNNFDTGLMKFRKSPSKYEAAASKAFQIKERQESPVRRPLSANGDVLSFQSQLAQARASSAAQKQILAKEKENNVPDCENENMKKVWRERDRAMEDKRKLREKLTSVESAQAQMTAVYEESLSNITTRLQQETLLRERLEKENIELQEQLNLSSPSNGSSNGSLRRPISISSLRSISLNDADKKKKKNWLRTSFAKLKRKKEGASTEEFPSFRSVPTSPSCTESASFDFSACASNVLDLERQLQEKDRDLSDIRLENLSLLHQIDQLKETVKRMSSEIASLKSENNRLRRTSRDIEIVPEQIPPKKEFYQDGKDVNIRLDLEEKTSFVSSFSICGKTSWDSLDKKVKDSFKYYLSRIDPASNLGLSCTSIKCYRIADVVRLHGDSKKPELLPYGYLVGDIDEVVIQLKDAEEDCIDTLAMETLIPKNILQRYVGLLLDNCKLIFSGPTATGKSYLARKLAEHVCRRNKKSFSSIAFFQVDQKATKELRSYLVSLAEQEEPPLVLCLDNVHYVFASLPEVLEPFSNVPIVIGTMTSSTAASLQLHHDFKWILYSTHVEPVKGLLGRFLRRRMLEEKIEIGAVVEWLPKVWQHVNTFIETYSSTDATLGPKLFFECPLSDEHAQIWFTDLWNFSLLPYIRDAVRDGLQAKRQSNWLDPVQYVLETYPWNKAEAEVGLLRLRAEDVGFDSSQCEFQSDDPLTNMLKRLQEATITVNENSDA